MSFEEVISFIRGCEDPHQIDNTIYVAEYCEAEPDRDDDWRLDYDYDDDDDDDYWRLDDDEDDEDDDILSM